MPARRARGGRHRIRSRGGGHAAARGLPAQHADHGGQRDRGSRHGGAAGGSGRRPGPLGDRDRRPGRQVHPPGGRADHRERHEQGLQRRHRLVPRGAGGVLRDQRHRAGGQPGTRRQSPPRPGADVHRLRGRGRGGRALGRLRTGRRVRRFSVLHHPQLPAPRDGPAHSGADDLFSGQASLQSVAGLDPGGGHRAAHRGAPQPRRHGGLGRGPVRPGERRANHRRRAAAGSFDADGGRDPRARGVPGQGERLRHATIRTCCTAGAACGPRT